MSSEGIRTIVTGGQVLIDGAWRRADLVLAGGTVAELAAPGAAVDGADGGHGPTTIIDADGLLVAPGYLDLQINGLLGTDLVRDPAGMRAMAAALPRYGVTSFLPTIITSPPAVVQAGMAAWADLQHRPQQGGATALGLHLEGPMLAADRKGAHPPRHLRPPSTEVIAGWTREAGVALVTLAPELPGALHVIRALTAAGVVVFGGHTAATAAEVQAAVQAGLRGLTHLYNAMPPLGHRAPGPVACGLTDQRLTCGLIVDGVHVDPMVVALTWNLLGPERCALVSDAVAATGMAPGTYDLGGERLVTDGRSVRLPDGTLAGSMLTLDQSVRNLVTYTGCTTAAAITSATLTPATLIGATAKGRISVGADADIVLLDPGLNVVSTLVAGVPSQGL